MTAAAVAIFVVISGIASRSSDDARLTEWADAQAIPTVSVAQPRSGNSATTLDLPGRLDAYSRAPIYARVSGYLKDWKVDIGTHVKAGQLLAEIEVPDQDQQLEQAKANLASAEANATLAASTAERWQALIGTNAVSRQQVDEKVGDFTTKRALVDAARANVARLQALERFKRIVAPFDGVITARDTDVGALINAGGGTGPQLFVVSDTRKLRVYVSVPQSYVPQVKPGTTARISVPERPGKTFTATVEASAQAVNPDSGATLMQLVVDNRAGELMSGDYATVRLALPADSAALSVPASALIFDKSGLRVATVGTDGHVALKTVTIARDLGKLIEISGGLAANDRVIESPPDGLTDGDEVRVASNPNGGALATSPPAPGAAGGRSYGKR
jgi:RND family efflux transporter MFP subunit